MIKNIFLATMMFHVRLLLTGLFSIYINCEARGYANISKKTTKRLKNRYHYNLWHKIIMLDVYNHAKVNGGWVAIFFYENIIMLVCYTITNLFATIWEFIYGQTNIMLYSLIGMFGLLHVHIFLFFIPDELFNIDWREKRQHGRKRN